MKKLVLLTITLGTFAFAGHTADDATSIEYKYFDKQEEVISDDYIVDANRRRGKKGMRGRRRGGGGLR